MRRTEARWVGWLRLFLYEWTETCKQLHKGQWYQMWPATAVETGWGMECFGTPSISFANGWCVELPLKRHLIMENLRNAVVVVGARFIEPDVSRKCWKAGFNEWSPYEGVARFFRWQCERYSTVRVAWSLKRSSTLRFTKRFSLTPQYVLPNMVGFHFCGGFIHAWACHHKRRC